MVKTCISWHFRLDIFICTCVTKCVFLLLKNSKCIRDLSQCYHHYPQWQAVRKNSLSSTILVQLYDHQMHLSENYFCRWDVHWNQSKSLSHSFGRSFVRLCVCVCVFSGIIFQFRFRFGVVWRKKKNFSCHDCSKLNRLQQCWYTITNYVILNLDWWNGTKAIP